MVNKLLTFSHKFYFAHQRKEIHQIQTTIHIKFGIKLIHPQAILCNIYSFRYVSVHILPLKKVNFAKSESYYYFYLNLTRSKEKPLYFNDLQTKKNRQFVLPNKLIWYTKLRQMYYYLHFCIAFSLTLTSASNLCFIYHFRFTL